MSGRFWWHMAALAAGASTLTPCWATPTVTLSLCSSQDGLVVQPGDTIDWQISFTVSQGDNLGLALLAVDFVQDKWNPGELLIPVANDLPAAMQDFRRPNGISNPGAGGYGGTQLGTDCEADLYQIGGAQNTFGVQGTNMGLDTTVDTGVGQSGAQELAGGEFEAPEQRGVYFFQLENAAGNVLETSTPPCTVGQAEIAYDPVDFSIIVCPGDVNGDAKVDLSDQAALLASYCKCEGQEGYNPDADLNRDGCVNMSDLAILLANYGSECD